MHHRFHNFDLHPSPAFDRHDNNVDTVIKCLNILNWTQDVDIRLTPKTLRSEARDYYSAGAGQKRR